MIAEKQVTVKDPILQRLMKPAWHNCHHSVVRKSVPQLMICEINVVFTLRLVGALHSSHIFAPGVAN